MSFQFTAYMVSANPKSIEALRWEALLENDVTAAAVKTKVFEEHNPQFYLALALLCKKCALVTVKNNEANNGLEAWRKGRQRVRMQYLLQREHSETILQTTDVVEVRWGVRRERVRAEVRQESGRGRQDRRHTGIGTTTGTEPHLNSHILKSYAQVSTMQIG